ncbi:MAG: MerR family transcriptional regulator [Candidatus Syntrophosphaera sp.]|nr:MerR family transcriptional regulator [Candidatus Syntrophosphaera sp.]
MKKYFYTIGEVSNILGEKPYVIRYWESEFSFLRPRKEEGRIRKYSQENILLLKKIQDMLHNQRFTIEGARQKLKEERRQAKNGTQTVAKAVEMTATEQLETLKELRGQLESIRKQCRKLIGKGK